jgi:hypothetical protein
MVKILALSSHRAHVCCCIKGSSDVVDVVVGIDVSVGITLTCNKYYPNCSLIITGTICSP